LCKPRKDETALELKARQTPATFVFDTEQGAFAQSLAHATDIDMQELGGFRRREALF
jgi:hypothetical protein